MKNSQLKDLRVMIIELLWTFKDSLRFAFMNKTETRQHKDACVCMCVRAILSAQVKSRILKH